MRYAVMTLIVCAALVPGLATRGQDKKETPKSDKARIKAVIDRLGDAWNEHDMAKFAAEFTDDADFINVRGRGGRGGSRSRRHTSRPISGFSGRAA